MLAAEPAAFDLLEENIVNCKPARPVPVLAFRGTTDPVVALRARMALLGAWSGAHPGLYKVLHESTLNQRTDMSFKEEMGVRTTAAIRRCMDAGLAPQGDAEAVALDLRTAVHGAVSLRVNQPDLPWPPLEEQLDRFLVKLVGVPPAEAEGR